MLKVFFSAKEICENCTCLSPFSAYSRNTHKNYVKKICISTMPDDYKRINILKNQMRDYKLVSGEQLTIFYFSVIKNALCV
jgi:hypothetical protein